MPNRMGSAAPTRGFLTSSMLLCLAAAICAIVFVQLEPHNPHASLYYVFLVYGLLLPVAVVYLRNNSDTAATYELPPFHIGVFAAAIVTILVISSLLAHGRLISDDSAYCFQARIFLSGKLAAAPMPGASADPAARPPEISFEHTIQAPWGWFTKYPPGWPAVLALGFLLHIPWLFNPILATVQMLCVWKLASPFGRVCQMLAVSFIASSIYYVMWSIGYMSHAFETTLALLALMTVLKSVKKNNMRWLVVSFVLVFVAIQVRPFTGIVIGGVCATIAVIGFWGQWRRLLSAAGVIISAAILSISATLVYDWIYTGDVLVSPYAASVGQRHVAEISLGLRDVLDNIASTTRWGLIDTATTTFPFLLLLAAYAVVRERVHRLEVIGLALLFPVLVVAHIIVVLPSGGYNGQRYYYEGFAAFAIVAARGAQLLIEEWRISRLRLITVLSVLLALQLVRCVVGVRAVISAGMPYVAMYNYAHNNVQAPLVFVHDNTPVFTAKHTNWNDANWASSAKVYLMDPGPERRDEVACRFGRPEWSMISYDPGTRSVSSVNGKAVCVGQTLPPAPRPAS